MIISEIIKKLEEAKSEHGDIPVYVFADHGQQVMEGCSVSYSYVDSLDEYMPEEVDEDDIDESSEKVIVIEG